MNRKINNNTDPTTQWQQAAAFFKAHFKLELPAVQQLEDFKQLAEPVQLKVIKLFTNKELKNTLLEQPSQHLIGKQLNQNMSGQQIGSYQLIQLIAHGGMSSVYRARKINIKSQKDVAIKLIPTNLQTAEITALFKRELETLSKLHHPNIISMHHGDVSQSGTPYLVMELVENALELDQFFNRQQTSLDDIINYFIILCRVIAYAHQNNIIHQDIKPSNVLMDEHGHLLVLDFGVAALAEVIPDHHAYTLNYAAPEQTLKNQVPHPVFDTYAITSLLIKCLSDCADSEPGWQNDAVNELKIDHDLKVILQQGIDEDVNQRYQQADDLAMDLSLWQKHLPISHLKDKPLYRLKKAFSRHPTIAILSALILISMTVGLVFYQQQYQIAISESNKAQQVKSILIEAIDQNDPDISKGNLLTVRDMLKQVEISHAENPTTDNKTAKELFLTLAQAFYKLGDYQAAEENINKLLMIEPQNTDALMSLAELKIQQKELKQAYQLASQLNQMKSDLSPDTYIKFQLLTANLATTDSDYETADKLFLQAEQQAKKLNQPKLTIKVMAAHANGLLEQDRMGLAVEKIKDARLLSQSTLGEQHSLTLELTAKLAETYLSFSGEKVELATELFNQLIPQQQDLLGENHPVVAKSLFLNGSGLRALNQLSAARENTEQALSIAEQQFGDQHIFTGKVLMSLGAIYLQEKNTLKAIPYGRRAVINHERLLGAEHPETLQYKTSYVAMLVENKQFEEALELLLQIHPIQTSALGADHRGTLYVDIVMSKTYTALGDFASGVQVGERCINNARKSVTKNIMEVFCALTLENAYFLNQQYDQSLVLIEQYQNDPLVSSRPNAKKQFEAHLTFVESINRTKK